MEGKSIDREQPRDAREITEGLFGRLPEIAKQLSAKYLDQTIETNRRLTENPDDPAEHQPNWHQWGIITHSQKVGQYFREDVPQYLKQWGVDEKVTEHMDERIGNRTKWELVEISVPLHDLGKFVERQVREKKGKQAKWNYVGHEKKSGEIVRWPAFTDMLQREYGLTREQIEYVAQCVERHYELANIRDAAIQSKKGFSLEFVESDDFARASEKLAGNFKEFEPELGIYYLADSLAKTDVRITAERDEDIPPQEPMILQTLSERGLSPKLANAVKQNPVSIASARKFLQTWAESQES